MGAAGLDGTLAALEAGTDVALANKESLIIGGDVVLGAAAASGAELIPVDSEHSAIAQALRAGRADEVAKLIVTASGGPFRGFTREQLETVTPEQALAHPTWDMGRVVTTNSAGLVNKGLEVIEAHLLFGIPYERIEVVVHPQSQVHSMVEFTDGSTIAQVSPPDMRLPIAYALGAGERISSGAPANDWTRASTWTFEPVDHEAFPALGLAVDAGRRGGTFPAVYNAANEVLVDAFHDRRIPFTGIADGIAAALAEHGRGHETDGDGFTAAEGAARSDVGRSDAATPLTREAVLAADERARVFASEWIAPAALVREPPPHDRAALHDRRRPLPRRHLRLHRSARARAPRPGQAVRGEGHPVHDRVRSHPVGEAPRRDRVRGQGAAAGRLHRDARHVPAGGQVEHPTGRQSAAAPVAGGPDCSPGRWRTHARSRTRSWNRGRSTARSTR